jgi:hypothetical protein
MQWRDSSVDIFKSRASFRPRCPGDFSAEQGRELEDLGFVVSGSGELRFGRWYAMVQARGERYRLSLHQFWGSN